MVEIWLLFSAYCPMKPYTCCKFHENIDDRFKVIEWIRFLKLIISKGHLSAKQCSRSYGSYSLHIVGCCFIFVPSSIKIALMVLKL